MFDSTVYHGLFGAQYDMHAALLHLVKSGVHKPHFMGLMNSW